MTRTFSDREPQKMNFKDLEYCNKQIDKFKPYLDKINKLKIVLNSNTLLKIKKISKSDISPFYRMVTIPFENNKYLSDNIIVVFEGEKPICKIDISDKKGMEDLKEFLKNPLLIYIPKNLKED